MNRVKYLTMALYAAGTWITGYLYGAKCSYSTLAAVITTLLGVLHGINMDD